MDILRSVVGPSPSDQELSSLLNAAGGSLESAINVYFEGNDFACDFC
jgi:hypothetical protein